MNIVDIINPWAALRKTRKDLEDARIAYWEVQWNSEILRRDLEAQLKAAHFRNPETGRIGRKGVRFK